VMSGLFQIPKFLLKVGTWQNLVIWCMGYFNWLKLFSFLLSHHCFNPPSTYHFSLTFQSFIYHNT
jgi:hypothetical protein